MKKNTSGGGVKSRRLTPVMRAGLVAMLAVGLGCSTRHDLNDFFVPDDVGTLVVDALLQVGRPLPAVRVTRALSPAVAYSPSAAAELHATVRVRELARNITIPYLESSPPGTYVASASVQVLPATAYELEVVTTAGETVRSRTTTPTPLSVDRWVLLDPQGQTEQRDLATFATANDSVYHANALVYAGGLIEARFARPQVEGFQLGLFSIDPGSDFVIRPEVFSDADLAKIDRQTSSPPIECRDGTLRLPWFAVFFQGRYKLKILALDHNAFDLLRSVPPDNGGFAFGGSPGSSFDRPIFHVEGGIGLFGSASEDSVGILVQSRP
jgi:hypothetical protein